MRIDFVRRMLALEATASDWWSQLSDVEKKAYLKAHPKSKFSGGRPDRRDEADQLAHSHAERAQYHDRLHDSHVDKRDFHIAGFHAGAAMLHGQAQHMYHRASRAYAVGDHDRGDRMFVQGQRFGREAKNHEDQLVGVGG